MIAEGGVSDHRRGDQRGRDHAAGVLRRALDHFVAGAVRRQLVNMGALPALIALSDEPHHDAPAVHGGLRELFHESTVQGLAVDAGVCRPSPSSRRPRPPTTFRFSGIASSTATTTRRLLPPGARTDS